MFMKKLLLIVICLASAMVSFALTIEEGKKYTIQNRNANYPFVKDDGSDIIQMGAFDESAYWIFEPVAGKTDCYYVKNAKTGRYAQAVSETTEVDVYMGTEPVEYIIKSTPSEGENHFGFTSADHANTDFTAGCVGWNWKGKDPNVGSVQSFAAAEGTNHRSFWKLTAYENPTTIETGIVYTISNYTNNDLYAKDDGNVIISLGSLDETAYWVFENADEEGCYYIRNHSTGDYAQQVFPTEGVDVLMDYEPVAYVIVNDNTKGKDIFGLTSADNAILDFTTGCMGWNWKGQETDSGTMQSFAAVAGGNPRSFWKLTPVEGVVDGIDNVSIKTTANIYNLQGQKIQSPVKGINIINGKKVIK